MSNDIPGDVSDDGLRAALGAAFPEPPVDDVDWIGLHGRIVGAAATRRRTVPVRAWWQPLAGWSRRGIPLAAAASALLVLAAGALQLRTAGTTDAALFSTVEEELAWGAGAGGLPLLDELDGEGMLDVALFYEEWQ
jgi:hypothetical protein